jgi:catechol 2,3-dioxygenase-like lactoylglutathione lyase family enzyme
MKNLGLPLNNIVFFFIISLTACNNTPAVDSTDHSATQEPFAAYNHTALVVSNLDASVAFYQQLFQFDTIPYPFPPRTGIRAKWLKIGEDVELHLGELEGEPSNDFNPGHLGFTVSSIDTLLKRLYEVSSAYNKLAKEERPVIDKMPYGARTIMINDPDGYGIHIIESTN